MRTAAWVTLFGGAAFAAAGAVALVVREVDAHDYNDNCVTPPAPLDASQQAQCSDWRSDGDTAANVAIGTLVTAGALGVVSGVLFYVTSGKRDMEARTALVCAPAPGLSGLAVSCAARF